MIDFLTVVITLTINNSIHEAEQRFLHIKSLFLFELIVAGATRYIGKEFGHTLLHSLLYSSQDSHTDFLRSN